MDNSVSGNRISNISLEIFRSSENKVKIRKHQQIFNVAIFLLPACDDSFNSRQDSDLIQHRSPELIIRLQPVFCYIK